MRYKFRKKNSHPPEILIPFFYYYYLFDYLKYLVPQLTKDGFHVTIVTCDKKVETLFQKSDELKIEFLPRLLRFFLNRSNSLLYRPMLWLSGWIWGLRIRMRFDFAVLPFDNKPLWYILSVLMPSLSCHNTTELIDVNLTIERDLYKKSKKLPKVYNWLDRLTFKKFLPRLAGEITNFRPRLLFVDRIMGYYAPNYFCGFSNIDFFTVSGTQIKENYERIGLDSKKTSIIVTGNPNYDHLSEIQKNFSNEDIQEYREKLKIKPASKVFSFFLSPSSFTELQRKEVVDVANEIWEEFDDAFLVFKFHPKIRKQDPPLFIRDLSQRSGRFLIITTYAGEEQNAKIILASDCIVQKQSTVGFIAMLFKKPIISYNIYETNYEDNQYKIMGASLHAESISEVRKILKCVFDENVKREIVQDQILACNKFCLETYQANRNISKVVQTFFQTRRE